MKTLLTLSLFLSLQSVAQDSTYQVTAWHQSDGITFMQVQFDFGWAVFQLPGDHLGKPSEMIQGCILTKRWGLYLFSPVPGLGYVKAGDEERIKEALGVQNLCSK